MGARRGKATLPKFLVETYSIHKLQYVIECENESDAADTFVCESDKMDELHQQHLDENIYGIWEISDSEFEEICKNSVNGHLKDKIIYKP